MKIGLYASMFGKDDPPTLQSIESYIDHAYDLRLDLIDFRRDRGFSSEDASYLIKTKLSCIEKGLSIGYLASGGHFVGSDEALRDKVATAKGDMDIALILGAPMIRLFCGQPLTDPEERAREIRCFQEVADYGLEVGIAMGLQNHPSTGDDVIRIIEETNRPNFSFLLDTGQWCGSPARNRGHSRPGSRHLRLHAADRPFSDPCPRQVLQDRQWQGGVDRLRAHRPHSRRGRIQRAALRRL